MNNDLLEQLIQKIVQEVLDDKESLDEYNAMSTGMVVGYTGPLGMDTTSIHKAFWSGDENKKGPKTASPKLK